MQSAISVTMISSKNIEITHLAENWLSLEKRSSCSFFLTWAWIGQWLTSLSTEYFVLQASDNNNVLGLAIMVKNTRKVFGLFQVKQWWLNRTGNEAYDQCWIEYNDFLVASEQAEKVNQAMLNFLSSASATSQ